MSEEDLLAHLEELETDAKDFVHGALADAREMATREYYQYPYADDDPDDGLSKFVTSEVQDAVEWILPSLIRMFMQGENAVEFEPRMADDEEGAMQATEACNYVFYVQNNGFMTLTTAIKDALLHRSGPVHWYWCEEEVIDRQKFKGVTETEIAYLAEKLKGEGEIELVGANLASAPVVDMYGNVVQEARYDIAINVTKKRGKIQIDAFEPENLLVARNWNSPLLEKCPYVCRLKEVSLSELRGYGYDVDADELGNEDERSGDRQMRDNASGDTTEPSTRSDEAMQTGLLRWEWVLIDYDGDGIAERRRIVRLGKKILENEPDDHVPIAQALPILKTHRWDGMSVADLMADIQRLKTELTRQLLNSGYFATTPRTTVLTDSVGNPQANPEDLLTWAPGTQIRIKQAGAVQPLEHQWIGGQILPLVQYVDGMKENRSGIGQYFTGNAENALNKTASGTNQLITQAQMRVEMIGRMIAETLVRPLFKGVFRLLTMYQIEPISFRLRGKYVDFDPQEWRDQYDMVINVGLGNNNKDQTLGHLMQVDALLTKAAQMGLAGQNGPIVDARGFHEVIKRVLVNMGFKQHEQFVRDPGDPIPPQPPGPPPEIVKTQMQLQAEAQKQDKDIAWEREEQAKEQAFEAQKLQFQAQTGVQTKVVDASLKGQAEERRDVRQFQQAQYQEAVQEPDAPDRLAEALTQIAQAMQALAAPKKVVRDAQGKVVGVFPDDAEPSQAQ